MNENDDFSGTFLTQVEHNQRDVDEFINLFKESMDFDGCSLCDGHHPIDTPHNAIICRHKKSFVHIDCCSNDCSMHGEPCRHAIFMHH